MIESIEYEFFPTNNENVKLDVIFQAAQSEDRCNINFDNIKNVYTDILPATMPQTLFTQYPHLNKATILPCEHTFEAVSLAYHFFRNSLSCPICRNGTTRNPLKVESLPYNDVAKFLSERCQALKKEEEDLEIQNEHLDIVNLYSPSMFFIACNYVVNCFC